MKECLTVTAAFGISGVQVTRILDSIALFRGYSRKHLVFVRRIPSVREITQRINARYDEMMAERLIRLW